MADYNFVTTWKFDTPLEVVYKAIYETDNYHLWWRGQRRVENIAQGDALGVGAIRRFRTRSILPYTLTYTGTVQQVELYKKVVGTAVGELEGTGTWFFEHQEGITTVTYFWVVRTNSFLLNVLTPVMRPLFEWNHNVVMRWGGQGLAKYMGCNLV
jgi:uncharacterized protein YndB with AHSA1/START domain